MSGKQTNLERRSLSTSTEKPHMLFMVSPWWSQSIQSLCLCQRFHSTATNLFFELGQLAREVGHQFHGGLQFLLQVSDLVLLPVCIAADQGHGPHPWEPVQVVFLVKTLWMVSTSKHNQIDSLHPFWHFPESAFIFFVLNVIPKINHSLSCFTH